MPSITGVLDDHLVVIGVPIWNLAPVGAQSIEGSAMAEKVKPGDHLVLIEPGGNDLFGDTTSREFEQALDRDFGKTIRSRTYSHNVRVAVAATKDQGWSDSAASGGEVWLYWIRQRYLAGKQRR